MTTTDFQTLHGYHEATLIHGTTGQELADVTLPDGLQVRIEGKWGPNEPDPYYADENKVLAIAIDDSCRYRIYNPRFA